MNLSPQDVEQVKFRVALRGYAEDEVDIFLDQVTDTISDLNRKLAEAQREVRELREAEAKRRRREMEDSPAPAAPLTPPLLGEEQPPLPVVPGPADSPPSAEYHDLPTQVIEPEDPAPAPGPVSPGEPGESPERPQWGEPAP